MRPWHWIGSLGLVGSVLAGCGGWHGAGATYRGRVRGHEPTYAFVHPGHGWEPADRLRDVQVAWWNRDAGAIIELRGDCEDQGDSSLDQYADHMRIDWTAWNVLESTAERLQGRAALRTVVEAELDGVPRKLELWVVKKDGCLFDLRYGASPRDFAAGVDAFHRVVAGFRFPVRG